MIPIENKSLVTIVIDGGGGGNRNGELTCHNQLPLLLNTLPNHKLSQSIKFNHSRYFILNINNVGPPPLIFSYYFPHMAIFHWEEREVGPTPIFLFSMWKKRFMVGDVTHKFLFMTMQNIFLNHIIF